MRFTWVAVVGLVLASAAAAQPLGPPPMERGGQGWSVLSGQTVGAGQNVVAAQLGWPGLSGTFLHGFSDRLDLGGGLALNYGEEGLRNTFTPGIKLQVLSRYMLLSTPAFNLGVSVAPGALFYFHSYDTLTSFTLPVGMQLGLPLGSAIMMHAGVDLPFLWTFGSTGGPVLPILVGGGAEYFLNSQLAATARLRMGPRLQGDNRPTLFTAEVGVGIAYKL